MIRGKIKYKDSFTVALFNGEHLHYKSNSNSPLNFSETLMRCLFHILILLTVMQVPGCLISDSIQI